MTSRDGVAVPVCRGESWHQGNLAVVGQWLASVVRGYLSYHVIPGNWTAIEAVRTQVGNFEAGTRCKRTPNTTGVRSPVSDGAN